MREDREILAGLATHDRSETREHDPDAEFREQMAVARKIMEERRQALRMLADYDKGLIERPQRRT